MSDFLNFYIYPEDDSLVWRNRWNNWGSKGVTIALTGGREIITHCHRYDIDTSGYLSLYDPDDEKMLTVAPSEWIGVYKHNVTDGGTPVCVVTTNVPNLNG